MILMSFSLCLHPDRLHVATGQIGKQPTIIVWHSVSLQVVSILKGGHEHGVGSVAFDREGQVMRFLFSFSFLVLFWSISDTPSSTCLPLVYCLNLSASTHLPLVYS